MCFMFSKKLTKLLACLLSASCLLATTSALTISADEENTNTNTQVFVLNEEDNGQPPVWYGDDGVMPCGTSAPSPYNVYDMSNIRCYDGEISSFKHIVYSEAMFTGRPFYTVLLVGSNMKTYLNGDSNRWVAINIYKSDGTLLNKITMTSENPVSAQSLTSPTVSTSDKVYFAIEKKNDGITITDLSVDVIYAG